MTIYLVCPALSGLVSCLKIKLVLFFLKLIMANYWNVCLSHYYLILLKILLSYNKLSLLFYGSNHMIVFRVEKKVFIPLDDDLYRVIHKSLQDFQTRLRNNQDRHGRKEHINR